MINHMKRKLRNIAGCLCVTIPKDVCELYDFKNGDEMEINLTPHDLKQKKLSIKKAH